MCFFEEFQNVSNIYNQGILNEFYLVLICFIGFEVPGQPSKSLNILMFTGFGSVQRFGY